jgi:hypothetical protein
VIDAIAQTWILATAGLGTYLLSRTDRWHRWGFVLSLAAQPAYVYSTLANGQWGMLALAVALTGVWYVGARRRFVVK